MVHARYIQIKRENNTLSMLLLIRKTQMQYLTTETSQITFNAVNV
jgi:hypothetical protein